MVRGQRGSNVAAGQRGRPTADWAGENGKTHGFPEGTEVAVAGVYLLTILPVYQSPAVDSLRGR